jgi:hypothetical protein
MKHRWKRYQNGSIITASLGDFHNGPVCAECGYTFCQYCYPEEWESECPGREGFKIRIARRDGNLLGIRWYRKALDIGFGFITIQLDFSGLFPYCEEVASEEDEE